MMEYAREEFTPDIVSELTMLIVSLFDEVGGAFNVDINPDWGMYMSISQSGRIILITVREDGRLVGYTLYIIAPMLHHKGIVFAAMDSIFLLPQYRGTEVGESLIMYSEKKIKKAGIKFTSGVTKTGFDFAPLLLRAGYEKHETVYIKELEAD